MRKRSSFINNQNGFFLPYVLFLMAIVLIVITANINTYKSDLQITDNQLEQLKVETLLQMGRTKFKQEFLELESRSNPVTYTFPDGTVKISYDHLGSNQYELTFDISTDKKSYTTTNILSFEQT